MEVKKIPKKTVTVMEPKKSMIVDKEKYKQLRVAAYCRVSTDSDEQLTSYKTQKKVYTEMIAQKPEWCLAGIYADEGISGTRADKRDEFQKMIKACLGGKIDYIITKSVSRFARNTVECLEYVRMLKSRGIGVLFEEQNIDTLKSDSELYLVIYAGFAQSESESMSKNITWSFRKNFEEGKVTFIYGKILGYRKGDNGEPEIDEEEAVIVEKIFDFYLSGMTLRGVAEAINAEFPVIPKKGRMSSSSILSILSNEKYCGDAILQKTITVDCISKTRRKNTGEAPMYYVQNNHPAIISREKFNKVQEELIRRKNKTPQSAKTAITSTGKYSKYALTEVLVCGECGSRFRRCTWARNGKRKVVWRCTNRLDFGPKYCKNSPTVDEDKLKNAVVRAINKFNENDSTTYLMLMKATIADAIGLAGNSEEIDILERKIDALNKVMMDIINKSVAEGSSVEDHEDEFKDIHDQIEMLEHRIGALREATNTKEEREEKEKLLQKTIEDRAAHSQEYDDTVVRQMIECIKIYHDGRIEVIFGGGISIVEELK